MWYRKFKTRLAGYSTNLGWLKSHLKGGIDPYDYPQQVYQYLEEDEPEDPWDHGHEWIESASEADQAAYRDWLGENADYQGDSFDPAYQVMSYEGMQRPQWMIHFTDDADAIEKQGFKYGHPELEGVHLTTMKRDRASKPGFNFAFPANSRDSLRAANAGKYGKDAIMFYSGAISAYHSGDEERQSVFWGPNANKDMIFPIRRDDYNGGWSVSDYSGRDLVEGKTFEEAVKWVETNYRMLQDVRNKTRRSK